jgi:hypothetical protein
MGYITVPIDTDPTDLAGQAFDYIEGQVPGWLPSPGNLEAWLIESQAQIAGELRALAALVPDSVFEFYGASILGLPKLAAVPATALTTWEAVDAAGYVVPPGTVVALTPPSAQTGYAFAVVNPAQIPAGETTIAGVECRALQPGTAASGLSGSVQVVDELAWVNSVTLDTPTSGGVDDEPTDVYLARLSDLLTLLAPRPILAQDFAVIARTVDGVARATAIDLYDNATGTPNTPRCVTVAVCDSNGQPCTTEVKQAVDDLLQSEREVNFLVYVIDPTYSSIDVQFDVQSYWSFDPVDVAARVVAVLTGYLSPNAWGVPPFGDTSARSWINDTKVRYLELTAAVNNVEGVHLVNSLTLGFTGSALAGVDVVLPGVAPLPEPGTIAGVAHQDPA